MKLGRDITAIINYILDNICPPILRDCLPIMYPIYWLACGKYTKKLLCYKDNYSNISDQEYSEYYNFASSTALAERPTDLNTKSKKFILSKAEEGAVWLDAGCGRGWLAKQLVGLNCNVTGVDIVKPHGYSERDGYKFVCGTVDQLPFEDNSFDNVVCSHVLEHVKDFDKSLNELIRVAKNRVVIVIPKQREYRYVADLHVRFFPYLYNVQMAFPKNAIIEKVGSDWGILIDKCKNNG